jgi:hypothetical protein
MGADMPRYENLSADELEQIKRFITETAIEAVRASELEELRALVEKHWPWLLPHLPPPVAP